MSEGRCTTTTNVDLPLKKRAMKKQFSPELKRRGENGDYLVSSPMASDFSSNSSSPRTRRDLGVAVNERVLSREDGEAFDNIMQKQLEIVEGSEGFYRRIDMSLQEGRVEPFFVKEQWDLYAWREKFFNDNFPQGSWFSDDGPAEDDIDEAVIPLQVTRNFTEVMKLASSTEERGEGEQHYFHSDPAASSRAKNRFSRATIKAKLEEEEECLRSWIEREASFTFPQLAHMVVEFHQDGLSLVFGCEEKRDSDRLRELLRQGKEGEEIPAELRERAEEGWYRIGDLPPGFLTGEGKKIFNDLRAIFSKEKKLKADKKEKVKKKVKL